MQLGKNKFKFKKKYILKAEDSEIVEIEQKPKICDIAANAIKTDSEQFITLL